MKRTFRNAKWTTLLFLLPVVLAAVLLAVHRPAVAAATAVLGSSVVWAWRVSARNRAALREARSALLGRTAELASLEALGREMQAAPGLPAILTSLERECRKILPVDHFFVASLEESAGELRFPHRWPDQGKTGGVDLLDRHLAEEVFAGQRTVHVHDLSGWKGAAGIRIGPHRSAAAVPLAAGNRLLGVLGVFSRKTEAYGEPQVVFLTAAAQYAAGAMANARSRGGILTDPVTGCMEREPFLERLHQEWARALRHREPLSVLIIALDHSTEMERKAGRPEGERHLAVMGGRIRATLRAYDVACRYRADAFAVLLPAADGATAHTAAERVRAAIARPGISTAGTPVRATVSIGIASYPEEAMAGPAALLDRADAALLRARRDGGNRVTPE